MRKILLVGAGRSSYSLIRYLLAHSRQEEWRLTVADVSLEAAMEKIAGHPSGDAIVLDVNDYSARTSAVANADLVISMLPAHMHVALAKDCVEAGKHLLTASYVSDEMSKLDQDASAAGVLLLNEMGLDPGIDHMSAMKIIDNLKDRDAEILSFKSYTGGLVAPESDDNPWSYKFSWNPRNVILAGQGTAKYVKNGTYRYIPYHRLFAEAETIAVNGFGEFDAYANRDSLSYRKIYGLENIPTMLRGTLRHAGFCKAWDVFVQLGLTDDSYKIENSENLTYRDLFSAFLPELKHGKGLRENLAAFLRCDQNSEIIDKIEWTGIFGDVKPGLKDASPAMMLQYLLEQKWVLKQEDKDMIVMYHHFLYKEKGTHTLSSTLLVKGEDSVDTAMAKTVGLPLAIGAKLLLNGTIKRRGVAIPVEKEIYLPVLKELEENGICFEES
ncbi:MAG: saccharopine dehydrogenase [Bacteroidetes bacterium]|nr:MAG: saccharopine dehydrogenase [Bacteroidota bacterium]REK32498.1 MAG: saccharopine dehydrogenase [Bacteroidota bacterium]REK49055.1 MAG: saccharopine dehydrogenase [Bacteroidota bacterium]